MASICKDPGGKKRILFVDGNGKRWPIRLGKMPLADARTIKSHIESLLASKVSGRALDNETAAWMRDIPDGLADKLAATGLTAKRENTNIDDLIKNFLSVNTHFKPSTQSNWAQATGDLKKHFGGDCRILSIGRAEAEGYRQWLLTTRKLSSATIAKRLQRTRQIFTHAVRHGQLDKSPFDGIRHASGDPSKRQHYISVEETERLIDAAPNWVWRTIIALARYGGLRCPSEVLSLQLSGLDWQRGAMTVMSPKTEHHEKGSRIVPMFEQLRPYLDEAWEMAEEGQTHVIPETLYLPSAQGKHGWINCNLRTTFQKIVDRAGLEAWPRLFQNLRASCESDLAREYPIATVCKWIGNTVAIAAKHYIQVDDRDFERAIQGTKRVAQNQAQSTHEKAGKGPQALVTPQEAGEGHNYIKPAASKGLRSLAGRYSKSFQDKNLGRCPRKDSNLGPTD